jgi:carbohydrate-binding DOMON domain-containing protein
MKASQWWLGFDSWMMGIGLPKGKWWSTITFSGTICSDKNETRWTVSIIWKSSKTAIQHLVSSQFT